VLGIDSSDYKEDRSHKTLTKILARDVCESRPFAKNAKRTGHPQIKIARPKTRDQITIDCRPKTSY